MQKIHKPMKKGHRHYDKFIKEIWWLIQENLREILVTAIIVTVFILLF